MNEMQDFFHSVALLRERYHAPAGFNLFSVLRSSSDEVRLHSRFLAYLLNPNESHQKHLTFLESWLTAVGVSGFTLDGVRVDTEYNWIDILIRNSHRQCILIENKIYAGMQDDQLSRYKAVMEGEGYTVSAVVYLTLDGKDPEPNGLGGMRLEEVNRIAYGQHIREWLSACLPEAVKDPGLREALLQYIELLEQLTGTDQGGVYMDHLKELMLKGDNLLNYRDVNVAYTEVLTDIWLDLWECMVHYQSERYPEMGKPAVMENNFSRERIKSYVLKTKGSLYYGISYPFKSMPGGVGISVDETIYYGIYSNDDNGAVARIKTSTTGLRKDGETMTWPLWRHPSDNVRLISSRNPTPKDLGLLKQPNFRQELATAIIDDAYDLWKFCRENLDAT